MHAIIFSNQKKWTTKQCKNMDESLMQIDEQKQWVWKGYIPYDSGYITFWKKKTKC